MARPCTVAYSGGMGFNFPRSPERFDTYIASAKKFGDAAKAAGATIIFSNHSMYDQAWIRSRWVEKARRDQSLCGRRRRRGALCHRAQRMRQGGKAAAEK